VDRQDSDLEAEVERLISLGATRVDWEYPDGADFAVLADTGGNVFCVPDAAIHGGRPGRAGGSLWTGAASRHIRASCSRVG
jgi:hypothetical protein